MLIIIIIYLKIIDEKIYEYIINKINEFFPSNIKIKWYNNNNKIVFLDIRRELKIKRISSYPALYIILLNKYQLYEKENIIIVKQIIKIKYLYHKKKLLQRNWSCSCNNKKSTKTKI